MAMHKQGAVCLIFLLSLIVIGCPEKLSQDARGGDGFGDIVDPAITAIDGAIDDQINSLFAANSKTVYPKLFGSSTSVFVKEAWAAACARLSTVACVNESRAMDYSSCVIDATSFIMNGSVNLTYTGTPNCGFTAVGDTVTRNVNISRTIPDNGLVKTISQVGGTKLTITGSNQFSLEILGIHKSVNNNANIVKNLELDIRTTSPITVTGGLDRSNRNINGGALEVPLGSGAFTLSPINLTYSIDCCYPVSGSIMFSGLGRSGTVTFPRCGAATITTEGARGPYDVELVSCE
jgi:hypothetical protein